MRVALYTDTLADLWRHALSTSGYRVAVQLIGVPLDASADIAVVIVSEAATLLRSRIWLSSLSQPTLIITPGVVYAEAICRLMPMVRLICHPTRAIGAPSDFIEMTRQIYAGRVVFGSATSGERGCYVSN